MAKETLKYIVLTADEYASLVVGNEINKTIPTKGIIAGFNIPDIEVRIVLDRRIGDAEVQNAFTKLSMHLKLREV